MSSKFFDNFNENESNPFRIDDDQQSNVANKLSGNEDSFTPNFDAMSKDESGIPTTSHANQYNHTNWLNPFNIPFYNLSTIRAESTFPSNTYSFQEYGGGKPSRCTTCSSRDRYRNGRIFRGKDQNKRFQYPVFITILVFYLLTLAVFMF